MDSTNIITPELSIITTIGLDHQNILGNSLNEIAVEKGGIIKYGKPTLLGSGICETISVLRKLLRKITLKFILLKKIQLITNLSKYQLEN